MINRVLPSIAIQNIDLEKCYFNPGCAASIYKPELPELMLELLRGRFCSVKLHNICCRHDPCLPEGATIINNCAGCDRRFHSEYAGIQTITYWEILDTLKDLKLPDHTGLTVSVHDSCSFRQKPQVHAAVRSILRKMNIQIIESEFSGTNSICCGDTFYSHIPDEKVAAFQRWRAAQMPCDDVVVYCIGCVRSMTVGRKNAHYLADLLFDRKTEPINNTLSEYHRDLDAYIKKHCV